MVTTAGQMQQTGQAFDTSRSMKCNRANTFVFGQLNFWMTNNIIITLRYNLVTIDLIMTIKV